MDTAQLAGAAETDPNVALANAADAFKLATSPPVPRDELGQFVKQTPPVEEVDEAEEAEQPLEEPDAEEPEDTEEDEPEAAQEAQPMPPSWPADEAEHWAALPPETQAYMAKREGERESAVQAKFQEAANVRKALEAEAEQAKTIRSQYADALDGLMASIQPTRPNPAEYGAGTGQYNREAYDLAVAEYDLSMQALAQLQQQRDALTEQEQQEAQAARQRAFAEVEEMNRGYVDKFLSEIPDARDNAKAAALFNDIFRYGVENGLDPSLFEGENVQLIPLSHAHLLWKAREYDKLKAAPPPVKAKPAGPAVRPGVSSPRSAQKGAQRQRAMDRLDREGSVEAGAAVFKHLFK